jgi:hypothetical protein
MNLKLIATIALLLLLGSNNKFESRSRENVLTVLGAKTDSPEFKDYRQFWNIDKNLENRNEGLKLYVNNAKGEVESISMMSENFPSDKTDFHQSSVLPFGISWDDDTLSLRNKLGGGHKLLGKNAVKFYRGNIGVEVSFNDMKGKIAALKFYDETKRIVVVEPITAKKETAVEVKMKEGLKYFEPSLITPTAAVKHDTVKPNYSSFKQAILDVFRSYNESSFYSIKGDIRGNRNFWNYHFTYATKLKIPGEKFNMLYSFPFVNSPLDFVSVIKESDAYDSSIEAAHKNFEKKLLENFSEKDGWVASCIPNKESKKLSDLEFRNDKYGAIILDYSKNPNGKHVVYLRFLLFSS